MLDVADIFAGLTYCSPVWFC